MSFSSITFLFFFLPIFLLIYSKLPIGGRSYLIIIGSILFYLWGSPIGLIILIATSLIDYYLGQYIYSSETNFKRKIFLSIGIIENIGILLYFKYSNFFIGETNSLLSVIGFQPIPWSEVIFPIGISFFTFHKMSYLLDIYYKRSVPAERFFNFAVYTTMFPKLIQGPIVRYHDIENQFNNYTSTLNDKMEGIFRFIVGLSKKVIIADSMGRIANSIFALNMDSITPEYAWLGALCYTFQIYFDFAGYSDMAIAIGQIMGFKFQENFNRPYISQSITDFWKRWHISLTDWFRIYLYIPLGGNRSGKFRTYLNLWIVFLISGLWHGANWTFIIWGIYHGFFLIIDRIFWTNISNKLWRIITIPLTFFIVLIGWVIFRSENIGFAFQYITRMFSIFSSEQILTNTLLSDLINNRGIFIILFASFLSFLPEEIKIIIYNIFNNKLSETGKLFIKIAICVILGFLSLFSLFNNTFQPFIYFRF